MKRPQRSCAIELATPADAVALSALEQSAFRGDRISPRSWQQLLRSRSARVTVARGDRPAGALLGAAVVLRRARSSIARLYSMAVAPSARGHGIARRLLDDAAERARADGAAVMRLETRVDNLAAHRLFSRCGFASFERKPGYYDDGAEAICWQKSLWNVVDAEPVAASHAPYYGQTLDFTCGPCALMMAMAALDADIVIDRVAEIRLWREATTVFMAAGHGGCGPFGLAWAASRRGFRVEVYAPSGEFLFIDSVRDPRKKDVIALVESDFRAELALQDSHQVTLSAATATPQRLAAHLRNGGVPVVLISLWRLHGEKGPHWVVVTGFDGHVFRILDPIAPPLPGDPGIAVSVEEFRRITRYGRRRQTAAVIVSKGH